jgi:hypothetical protein
MTDTTITLGSGFVTTRQNIADEILLVRSVDALIQNSERLVFSQAFLEKQRRAFIQDNAQKPDMQLTEQARIVFDEMTGDENGAAAIMLMTGPPGSAKSTVAALWAGMTRTLDADIPIMLVAQEKPALHRLTEKLGLKHSVSVTLEDALRDSTPWPEHGLVIIDEAGLLGTRAMARLLQRAAAAHTRHTVLIGDDKQLLPREPGHPFRWLRESGRVPVIELHAAFRQRTPELREAVDALYCGDTADALGHMDVRFTPASDLAVALNSALDGVAPDKTLVMVHGPDALMTRLRNRCAGYRFYSLAAAQGLAVDHIFLVIAAPLNMSEFLVGCSRQRFSLGVFVDSAVYADKTKMGSGIAPFPRAPMALDHADYDTLVKDNLQG